LNLLIADDNATVRRFIADILTPFASEILECADGAEAVLAYSAERRDLVLMDIRMGEMNGIEATKRIRMADPAAKIIIVTNLDEDALRQEAAHEGACAYVLKDNLLDLLRLVGILFRERTNL
jgi:CheY-like chemotaxis protein